jgi:hypothetical protein
MAEHKIQGGNVLLFIDPYGGTNYEMVVCLTSISVSDSVNVVDASSACGPDKSPGALEISYSFEGQHIQDPDSGEISGTDLRQLLRSEQTIGFMIAPEIPQAGDEIQTGTGWLSELSSTYAFDAVAVFSGVLQPYGEPVITISPGTVLTVGQAYQGGKIAYLDGTGEHGIIVSNQTYEIEWCQNTGSIFGATSTAYGDGAANQAVILTHAIPLVNSAGYVCDWYQNDGYTDWVIPTNDDATAIQPGLSACAISVGTWASEFDGNNAYYMGNDGTFYGTPKDTVSDIIPIRYF